MWAPHQMSWTEHVSPKIVEGTAHLCVLLMISHFAAVEGISNLPASESDKTVPHTHTPFEQSLVRDVRETWLFGWLAGPTLVTAVSGVFQGSAEVYRTAIASGHGSD
jgi:hypothetical protein